MFIYSSIYRVKVINYLSTVHPCIWLSRRCTQVKYDTFFSLISLYFPFSIASQMSCQEITAFFMKPDKRSNMRVSELHAPILQSPVLIPPLFFQIRLKVRFSKDLWTIFFAFHFESSRDDLSIWRFKREEEKNEDRDFGWVVHRLDSRIYMFLGGPAIGSLWITLSFSQALRHSVNPDSVIESIIH